MYDDTKLQKDPEESQQIQEPSGLLPLIQKLGHHTIQPGNRIRRHHLEDDGTASKRGALLTLNPKDLLLNRDDSWQIPESWNEKEELITMSRAYNMELEKPVAVEMNS